RLLWRRRSQPDWCQARERSEQTGTRPAQPDAPCFETRFNRRMTRPGKPPASTEMTMLIELDSGNRASLRRLFDGYPCLHGSVAAAIEGGMGRVFADAQEEPRVALAILDFHFLAGDPLHANAPLLFKLLQPRNVVIAPTPAWRHLVTATYQGALTV